MRLELVPKLAPWNLIIVHVRGDTPLISWRSSVAVNASPPERLTEHDNVWTTLFHAVSRSASQLPRDRAAHGSSWAPDCWLEAHVFTVSCSLHTCVCMHSIYVGYLYLYIYGLLQNWRTFGLRHPWKGKLHFSATFKGSISSAWRSTLKCIRNMFVVFAKCQPK